MSGGQAAGCFEAGKLGEGGGGVGGGDLRVDTVIRFGFERVRTWRKVRLAGDDSSDYMRAMSIDITTYNLWIEHVFDLDSPNYQVDDPLCWTSADGLDYTLAFLTRFFENSAELVGRYPPISIDLGLMNIVGSSDYTLVLSDTRFAWPERRRCFDAMMPLYENLIAPVFGNSLTCQASYIWWDAIRVYGNMPHPDCDRINDAVLHVFEHVLSLSSEACLISVLHGLGHWHAAVPSRTEPLVRRLLTRNDISPQLRQYAELAAVGRVL